MPAAREMTIKAEYTGVEPNLKPAASACAQMMKSITNPDGTFKDTELEKEFQKWREENGKQ